jgi:hypothetical protein
VTAQARLATIGHALFPELSAWVRAMIDRRMLPQPVDGGGDIYKSGAESHSRWAPSALTTLADRAVAPHNELPQH